MVSPSPLPTYPGNLKWWAVRLGSLILAAVVLVVLAGVIAAAIESRTLATRTVRISGGEKIEFRIHREHGDVFASAKQVRSGLGTGWSNTIWLGTTKSLGGTDANIQLDESAERVVLRAGEMRVIFDLNSNHFDFPKPDSQ